MNIFTNSMLDNIEEQHELLTNQACNKEFVEKYLETIECVIREDCFEEINRIYSVTGIENGKEYDEIRERLQKLVKYYDDGLLTGSYDNVCDKLMFKMHVYRLIDNLKGL